MSTDPSVLANDIAELAEFAAEGKEEWQTFNSAFFQLYPGSFTSFNVFERRSMSLLMLAADDSFPKDLEYGYIHHYGSLNPWNDFWPRASIGRPYATTRTLPSSLFTHTEFYNDWLLKTGTQECVGMKLVTSDDEVIVFSTMMPSIGLEKNEIHALELFDKIAPSLIKGVESSRLSAKEGAQNIGAAAIVDRSPDIAIVVNYSLKVVVANEQAEQALKVEKLVAIRLGCFSILDSETAAWIATAVHALLLDRPLSDNRRLCRIKDQYVEISLSRLPYSGRAPVPIGMLQPFLMLIIIRELNATSPIINAKLLVNLFGFTEAEATISTYIREGLTVNEIASLRNISRETVRYHLKAIFRKSGTSRQAELVALLQRLR